MATRNCVICGKEFELRFGDTRFTNKCPTCDLQQWEAQQAPALPVVDTSAASFPVTIALVAANALVFLIMILSGASALGPTPQQAISFGADYGPLTFNGQWWRLVSSMFVHFGAVHIALNMWCLWNLGRAAERLLGRFSYLFAYFASGIFGSIASVYSSPLSVGAGASGAVFGLAGVLVSFVYLKKTPAHLQLNSNLMGSLGTFIIFNLIYSARPGVSMAAHVGGLVMGLAVGALLPAAAASESSRRTRLSVVVLLTAAALVASAVAAKRLRTGVAELSSIQQLISEHKSDEALGELQQLTARQPQLAPAQAMLASLYMSRGQYPEAISALEKANGADPGNAVYQGELGSAYLATQQFDQAIAFFHKLVRDNPRDSRAFLGLGYAYIGLQQYDPAISEFREAVTLDPKSADPQFALGQAQLKAGHYADAETTYRHLVSQFPNDPRAQAALAYASRQARQAFPPANAPPVAR
jgi:membrane associated rhomboid family serine protease/thioredoxin-like negative regulator of GroEL